MMILKDSESFNSQCFFGRFLRTWTFSSNDIKCSSIVLHRKTSKQNLQTLNKRTDDEAVASGTHTSPSAAVSGPSLCWAVPRLSSSTALSSFFKHTGQSVSRMHLGVSLPASTCFLHLVPTKHFSLISSL